MVSPQEGVARAMAIARTATRPVVIADTQDNPGCGGTADSTGLLRALVDAKADGAVLGFLCDAEAAKAAHAAGEGAAIDIALGGRSGPEGVTPFQGRFTVTRLGSGKFRTSGAVSGGREVDLGPMALLTIGGVSVAAAIPEDKESSAMALRSRVRPSAGAAGLAATFTTGFSNAAAFG